MSLVPGHHWDVFVSYARSDDESPTGKHGWVTAFVRALKIAVRAYLGTDISLFFDVTTAGAGNSELDEIKRAASNSAIFLAIGSPSYTKREWTRIELEIFRAECQEARRLFVIERLPLGGGDDYPTAIAQQNRRIFWKTLDEIEVPAPLSPRDKRFNDLIHDVAHKIVETLKLLAPEGTVPLRQASLPAPCTVLLAQGTDDVSDQVEEVQRYLSQYPELVRVLPPEPYPQGGNDFKAAFGRDLAKADIFVQLLGARAGRAPPDLPTSYTLFQLEAARAAGPSPAGKTILQWRHPELAISSVADDRYRAILDDPNVMVTGFEEFKAQILEAARQPHDEPSSAGAIEVFINADRTNMDAAVGIQREFARARYSTALPKFDGTTGDNRSHLNRMMAECGVLVFVHGCSEPIWFNTQRRLFDTIRPKRKADPEALAICTVPPAEPPPQGEIGDEFEEIDCSDAWEVQRVRDFIARLQQRGGSPRGLPQ